jgi:opacity protein-like surface antigen
MKNVRTLLVAAVLAAAAACSGDATAPEAVQHPARPSLENVVSDTTAYPDGPGTGTENDGGAGTIQSGLVGPGAG